jgi:hypothetical protein
MQKIVFCRMIKVESFSPAGLEFLIEKSKGLQGQFMAQNMISFG